MVILTISAAVLSCNRYTAPNSRQAIEDRRTTREARYNLTGFPGDQDVITADVPASDDTVKAQSDQLTFPEFVKDSELSETVFSVQVYASKSSEEASEFEADTSPLFDEIVRTDYRAPYYKVRIGACTTLEEGEALLEKVKGMGFKRAWLVRVSQ